MKFIRVDKVRNEKIKRRYTFVKKAVDNVKDIADVLY